MIGNRIAEKNVKPKPVSEAEPKSFEEIYIPPEQIQEK